MFKFFVLRTCRRDYKNFKHTLITQMNYMQFDILTIFPKIINDYSSESILKRGQKKGLIKIQAHDFRKFTTDKHHKVDDSPYGGGAGMVLKVEPIYRCLKELNVLPSRAYLYCHPESASWRKAPDFGRNDRKKTKIIILDPSGKKFNQKMAQKFSKLDRLVLICGRYEGFDERIYKFVDEKISVGDYVLSGGELGALAVTEAVARLIPGVLGNEESLREETFSNIIPANSVIPRFDRGIQQRKLDSRLHWNDKMQAEYPHYTRPENFKGLKVPKVLLSGDHKKIAEWRKKKSA